MYYTYVLKSKKDDGLYIGSTSDLVERVKQHNNGNVQSTKNRRPLFLLYYEACISKQKVEKREEYFKTGFGRGFLKSRM
ncbi:MAG: GIY-YIG catalytic domain protein [Candidatus Roizmanbacteria bacterium GW2011_GWC2_35_12]|nr:MAG: GIY-YIG catalytic domain protein [Candidatus Roizmanbacteria bacterium GW2011_GWC2_35_12]